MEDSISAGDSRTDLPSDHEQVRKVADEIDAYYQGQAHYLYGLLVRENIKLSKEDLRTLLLEPTNHTQDRIHRAIGAFSQSIESVIPSYRHEDYFIIREVNGIIVGYWEGGHDEYELTSTFTSDAGLFGEINCEAAGVLAAIFFQELFNEKVVVPGFRTEKVNKDRLHLYFINGAMDDHLQFVRDRVVSQQV